MVSRDVLRSLSQLASVKTPIESTEFRDLLLRHLISSEADDRPVSRRLQTAALFDAYDSFGHHDLVTNDFKDTQIQEFYEKHYLAGYNHGLEERPGRPAKTDNDYIPWPACLPRNRSSYPKEVVASFAAYMGYQDAKAA